MIYHTKLERLHYNIEQKRKTLFSIYLTEILQLSLMYEMKLPKDLVPYFPWPLWHVQLVFKIAHYFDINAAWCI